MCDGKAAKRPGSRDMLASDLVLPKLDVLEGAALSAVVDQDDALRTLHRKAPLNFQQASRTFEAN